MPEKIIYTKWLAYELRTRGFELLRTGINYNFPEFNTYIFKDSVELEKAITELTKKK